MLPRLRWLLLLLTLLPLAARADEPEDASPFKRLKFRAIGPAVGGRVCRVAGVPGDPRTCYLAAAAGGVWKSTDGGHHWQPLTDKVELSSAGSIAIAPSDPNVLYVGSGEANIRGNVTAGNGIWKSTDAGKTWKHVWKQEGQIGTLIVHPANPAVAFAAVLGHAFGPNGERGVYRTRDGGKTWQKVLGKDADTGASDVAFDPSNAHVLFAGLWQARRRPWDLTSGGPGSGLYVSRDGGDTWKQLGGHGIAKDDLHGLPEGIYGKVGVAVAPSDGRRVYALIEAEDGGLFRSDDGGETWKKATDHHGLRQRAWYYTTLTVDPANADVVWFPQVPLLRTIDGGKSLLLVKGPHHGDHHDLWIDPRDPKRILDANDGGVDLSNNGGETWFSPPLPLGQLYRISVDNRVPYHVSGTFQDVGCFAGPSNSLHGKGIGVQDWYPVGGGETGYTASDPANPDVVYAGEYGGTITRFDAKTRQARNVSVYPENPSGHGAEDMKYRFRWPAPLLISPHDPKVLYHAANVLFRTADGGQTWTAISPDLTRNDKARQKWAGGPITGDNTTVEYFCTISAVAESPKQKDLLWAGSDDGRLHLSKDGGKTWEDLTAKLPAFPEWATVTMIEPSRTDAGTAYVVIDAHLLDDPHPYLFKTADFGQTWKALSGSLPQDTYLHVVREDPKKKGLLYLGTERGVTISADDGATWQPLKLNLPTVAVTDLVVKDNDLVLATNGRSVWIFDDLTPLREWAPAVADAEVHLFPAQPAVRWRLGGAVGRTAVAENPPTGAVLHYYLKKAPKGDVTLDVLDATGKVVVRSLSSKPEPEEPEVPGDYAEDDKDEKEPLPTKPGLHRVVWDLTFKGAEKISRAKADAGDPTDGPLTLPGNYTAKLTVEAKTYSVPLVVQPDPRLQLPAADLAAQQQFVLSLRDDLTRLSRVVEQLRAVRKQLEARNDLVKDEAKAEPLIKASKELITKLDALEAKLHNPKAQVTYDILAMKGGAQLYSRLGFLYLAALEADGPPTQGMKEVYAAQVQELRQLTADWQKLLTVDLAALNDQAKKLDLPHVFVPTRKEP